MRVIAHRGFADDAPENTIFAVRSAAAIADVVEVDVRRCGSGELVVFHDERVDRVTEGTGPVADYDLAELQSLQVCGSDQRIPTLPAVLEAVDSGTSFSLELKESGLAVDVLDALAGSDHSVVVSSFDPAVIEEVDALEPTRPTALIASRLRERPIQTAERLGCAEVHLDYRLCFVPGVVRSARAAGLTVDAWTVRWPFVVRALDHLGVDGVAVDSIETVPTGLRRKRD